MRPTPIRLIALFPTSEPDIVLGDRVAKEEHDVGEREAEFAAASACARFGARTAWQSTLLSSLGPIRAYLSRTADSDGPSPVRLLSSLPASGCQIALSLYSFPRGCR